MVSLMALRELEREYAGKACAEHPDMRLAVVAGQGVAIVYCASCKGTPAAFVEVAGFTKRYLTGQALPAAVQSKLARKHGGWTMPEQTGLALRDPSPTEITDATARFAAQMPTYDDGAWKALRPADRLLAAKLLIAGFQPFHFTIMSYKSKGVQVASLHLNLQGREYNARQAMQDRFGGVTVRPMSPQERSDWQLDQDEVGAVATLWERDPRTGTRWEAMQDIGRAGGKRDAIPEGRDWGGNPIARTNRQEQAMARARARVLINGAPLGVPISTFTGVGGDVITVENTDHYAPEALPEGVAADTAENSPSEPEATLEPEQALPPAAAPVAPAMTQGDKAREVPASEGQGASAVTQAPTAPAVPTINPAAAGRPLDAVRADKAAVEKIKGALRDANALGLVRDFSYSLQLGVDAVLQLAADGYSVEQIVAVVKGEAKASLGW